MKLPATAAAQSMGYLERTHDWNDREVIEWLRKGFALYQNSEGSSARRFAFDPVEVSLEHEPLGQLAGALLEGDNPALPAPAHVERAIVSYLMDGRAIEQNDAAFFSGLWMLLSGLNLKPSIAAVARQFLGHAKSLRQKETERLVRAVASAVASIQPVTNLQISFFEHLHSTFPRIWAADLTVLIVDLGFAKAADDRAARAKGAFTPAEAWTAIRTRWKDEIVEALENGAFRANVLASIVARHLGMVGREATPEALLRAMRDTEESESGTVSFESFQPFEEAYA
ncbi:MAG TPA: hypothetical protein VD846_11915 [Allosphingosinicella sp.]|nr:hypothetical protein [Allosphingosinicella sp.]